MQGNSELIFSNLSLDKISREISEELKMLETAFNIMKENKKITWKDINPLNGIKLTENGFFDHLCNKKHEKKLKELYFKRVDKNKEISQTAEGKGFIHDILFSLIFLKESEKKSKIVLEPSYFYFDNMESSPDMVVENNITKYSLEVKTSKTGANKRGFKQIKNSFEYDECEFGICAYPSKKITKIGRINKNMHFLCFFPEENYSKLECLGLEKIKEKKGIVQVDYLDIKEFLNKNIYNEHKINGFD